MLAECERDGFIFIGRGIESTLGEKDRETISYIGKRWIERYSCDRPNAREKENKIVLVFSLK